MRSSETISKESSAAQRISVRLALPLSNEEDVIVAKAMRWLVEHRHSQPSLSSLAEYIGESPFSLQKRFLRWAGVSPKVFLSLLNCNLARSLLQQGASVMDTAYTLGLSAPSRLHDLFLRIEAMTPGEYKSGCEGLVINYATHPTPFGLGYFAASARGLCALGFKGARFPDLASAKQDFQKRWPKAKLCEDASKTTGYAEAIFSAIFSRTLENTTAKAEALANYTASCRAASRASNSPPQALSLHLIGSPFRLRVWEALLRTPPGAIINYASLATSLAASPRYARAVGQAVAHNPISFIIPCHRVIRQSGALGNYYWGVDKKLAMLGCENSWKGCR